jgi:peptide/nickel transport system ATP-binding protein
MARCASEVPPMFAMHGNVAAGVPHGAACWLHAEALDQREREAA